MRRASLLTCPSRRLGVFPSAGRVPAGRRPAVWSDSGDRDAMARRVETRRAHRQREEGTLRNSSGTLQGRAQTLPPSIAALAVRILVVEDEEKVARALQEGLEAEAYDVTLAPTGEDGFFRASAEDFDLVILDLMLPGRDGLHILATMRQRG